MEIAIIADDNKKELMAQFCIAYCGILAKHTVCATNTTGRLVAEATGLPVQLWDERMTTVSAIGYLNQTDVRGKKRKQVVDTVAATIILQDFLDSRK